MGRKTSVERIEDLIAPIFSGGRFELADVEFVKEGANWYLRIFIDKEGGVSIDDCEAVSREAERILDEKDPISQPYILEVSSPGIDRPLKKDSDFEKYKGSLVDIRLYKPVSGRKDYQGSLLGLKDGIISIKEEDGNEVSFSRKDVAAVRLAVVF